MPGRKFSAAGSGYRYGFNGKENDNSTGEGNLDFGARIMDVRLGRFLSIDPLINLQPFYSPYMFAGNKPIIAIDKDGLLEVYVTLSVRDARGNITEYTTQLSIKTAEEVVYGLYRTPVHLSITANIGQDAIGGAGTKQINEIKFVEQTGGYDDYESLQSVQSFGDNLLLDMAMGASKYTGIKDIMEGCDGKTIEGIPLNNTARLTSLVEGGKTFTEIITSKSGISIIKGMLTDKVENEALDLVANNLIAAVTKNDDKSTDKDQMTIVLKSIYSSAKESKKGGSFVGKFLAFIKGGEAVNTINDATKKNPNGILPYGPNEVGNAVMDLLSKPGGWDGLEAQGKALETVTIESSNTKKE